MALLIAALVLTSSVGLYYYYEYSQESQLNANLTNELDSASEKYDATASQYNKLVANLSALSQNYNKLLASFNGSTSSFRQVVTIYNQSVLQFNLLSKIFLSLTSQYNITISLLTSTVSQLNTSETAYGNASRMLSGLWENYTSVIANYKSLVQNYSGIFSEFKSALISFSKETNITTSSSSFQEPTIPISTSLLTSNILFDFGNSTNLWVNGTSIQPGWNLFVATLVVTNGNIQAIWYPQYSEHFVTAVDGVQATQTKSWFVWYFNTTSSTWVSPAAGADQLTMYNDTSYAWTLCGYNSATFLPTCTPS